MTKASRELLGVWLGRRSYEPVHRLQLALHEARKEGRSGDLVIFVEHDPVITFGRGAHVEHLLASEQDLAKHGIDLAKTGRGGDVTLHAPGQLVAYPILDLNPDRRDVRRYVHDLTECMRRVAQSAGVSSGRIAEHVGLWVDLDRPRQYEGEEHATSLAKIGAIGVRVSRWVTMHGFALNLSTNLELYRLIVPCGIAEYPVASLASLVGEAPTVANAALVAFRELADILDATPTEFCDLCEVTMDEVLSLATRA